MKKALGIIMLIIFFGGLIFIIYQALGIEIFVFIGGVFFLVAWIGIAVYLIEKDD